MKKNLWTVFTLSALPIVLIGILFGMVETHRATLKKAPTPPITAFAQPFPTTPTSWTQSAWCFDPQNTSGTASDNNSCLGSTSTCCITFAQVASRWGTLEPVFPQTTTLTQLSSQTTEADPIVIRVHTTGAANFYYTGTLTTVQTGTFSLVTAKTYGTPGSPGAPLQLTLSAGAAAGELVVNSSRTNSQALLYKVVSGTIWDATQPLAATTLPPSIGAENNAWVTGDSYTVSSFTVSDIVEWTPSAFGSGTMALQQTQINDPSSTSKGVIVRNFGIWQSVSSLALIDYVGSQSGSISFENINSEFVGGLRVINPSGSGASPTSIFYIFAGDTRSGSSAVQSAVVADDVILGSTFRQVGGEYGSAGGSGTDGVYLDTGATWDITGGSLVRPVAARVSVYGPGTISVDSSAVLTYAGTGNTATNIFLQTGFNVDGSTTACSQSNGAASVINCGITLNPTNLDAAFGVAGFGSIAKSFLSGAVIQGLSNQ
jgi:hypothetical protein